MNNETHMNPNFPKQRGCFIDKRNPAKIVVVDYPTWSNKNGRYTVGDMNKPIADGNQFEKEFDTIIAAYDFAKSENYAVCMDPWTKPVFDKKPDNYDDIED